MTSPRPMDLAAALEEANLAVLVAALAHRTGDLALLDRWDRDAFFRLRNPTAMDDATAAEIRALAVVLLAESTPEPAPAADAVHRIAEFCAGEPVDHDYVPLIEAECDFAGTDPRRPVWDAVPPVDALADFHVVIVGAGLAGVAMAVRLGQLGIRYTIFDKNPAIGGTWWENDYPGLRVDVPNLFYSYSFAPNTEWSQHYSLRDELQAYVARCADDHGVTPHVRFGHEVTAAEYDPDAAQWTVRVQPVDGDAFVVAANAVVSGVGMLNRPCVPDLPGLGDFAGPWFHSSHWPDDLDVTDRRVAVIGTGASAVQVVPGIAERVAHLDVFQRSRHWMMPNPVYLAAMTEGERWLIAHVPSYAGWLRFLLFWNNSDRIYDSFRIDPDWESPDVSISASNDKLRRLMTGYLRRALDDDEDLIARVLPDYPPLGKRILQDGGWFAALRRDHVDLVVDPIERIVPEGVVTADGVLHPADVLVLATGFHARRFLWPIDVVGPGGRLHAVWGDEPTAYLGITVPGFPNLFCLYGPNTNPVVGSVIFMLECQVDYVARCLMLLLGGHAAMDVRREVHDDYNARVDAEMEQMVWRHPKVHSYYNNDEGRVVTNAPWRLLDYWRMTRRPDPDDYVLVPAAGAGGEGAP